MWPQSQTAPQAQGRESLFSKPASGSPVFGQTTGPASGSLFGQTTPGTGGSTFGQTTAPNPGSIFGQTSVFGATTTGSGAIFGQTTAASASVFGQTTATTTASASIFGQSSGPVFGQTATPSVGQTASNPSGSIFGQPATTTSAPIFGQSTVPPSGSVFGQTTATRGGSPFGQTARSGNIFSQTTGAASGGAIFGKDTAGGTVFGQPGPIQTKAASGSIFGQTTTTASFPVFGQTTTTTAAGFGQQTTLASSGSMFGQTSTTATGPGGSGTIFGQTTASGFGQNSSTTSGSSVFGQTTTTGSASIFGQTTAATSTAAAPRQTTPVSGSIFRQSTTPGSGSVFGQTTGTTTTGSSMFGQPATTGSGSIFGQSETATAAAGGQTTTSGSSMFGQPVATAGGSIFGQSATAASSSIFTQSTTAASSTPLFGQTTTAGGPVFTRTITGGSGFPQQAGESQAPIASLFKSKPAVDEGLHVLLTAEDEAEVAEADKPQQEEQDGTSTEGGRRKLRRPGAGTVAGRGLFGKALSGVTKQPVVSRLGRQRGEVGRDQPAESAQPQDSKTSDKDASTGRTPRRRSTIDEIASKVAIVCKNIPLSCNNKATLTKHFSRFGEVKRVYITKSSATIHFDTHVAAENAKRKGRLIKRGDPAMNIFWSSHNPAGGSAERKASAGDSSAKSRTSQVRGRQRSDQGQDVADELAGMTGTSDISGYNVQERPSDSRSQGRGVKARAVSPSPSSGREQARSVSPSRPNLAEKVVSLSALSRLVGHTGSEKCEILNQRDKLLRQARGDSKSHGDIATAKATRGTCPDMCPEMERYLREERRRLHVYEIIPGTDVARQNPQVNHALAVKEYSRSSADQDMPLPNELRPPEILDMTMNYILHNIMDRGVDGKWADWFDFVWNRTRAIRKDITQQMLCDVTAAELTEKCARFHIFCSERLCEEDMATFDEKINDENLTKCLQTLKELYHDLEEKHQLTCPHEAEFRAYLVLMHLNEGDILRETQQLREEVRESREVKFAVSVYSALNSNNYIRFFKLVGQATFMNACILHKYFMQVRQMALLTMLKAYGPVRYYPLSEISRRLAFETEEEALEFCQHYCLRVSDGQVSMDRASYVTPEASFPQYRAVGLIEGKLTGSVGEAVNGGPLPPNILHQPIPSFDASGHFVAGGDISAVAPPTVVEQPQIVAPSGVIAQEVEPPGYRAPPPPYVVPSQTEAPPGEQVAQQVAEPAPPFAYTKEVNEAVKDLAKELFIEVISEFTESMGKGIVNFAEIYLGAAGPVCEQIIEQDTPGFVKELTVEALEEARLEHTEAQARERAERSARRDMVAKEVVDDITDSVVDVLSGQVALQQFREVQIQLRRESCERGVHSLMQELLGGAVEDAAELVAEEVYEVDVEQRLRLLANTERAVQMMRVSRFFKLWKDQYAGRLRLKRSMQTFPSAPPMDSLQDQFRALLPNSKGMTGAGLHLGHEAMLTLADPMEVVKQQQDIRDKMAVHLYMRRIQHEAAWAPLELPTVIGRRLMRQSGGRAKAWGKQENLLWKLLVSLPGEDGGDEFREWITSKFKKGAVPNAGPVGKSQVLSLYSVPVEGLPTDRVSLGVCVRAVTDILTESDIQELEQKHCMLGSSALVFVISTSSMDDDDEETFWLEQRLRLSRVLQCKPAYPSIPLLVVCDTILHTTQTNLQLQKCVDDGLVSEYDVIFFEEDVEQLSATQKLIQAIKWLAERSPKLPDLVSSPVREFVDDMLGQEYLSVVYQDLASRRKIGLLDQAPNILVSLYNALLEHMVVMVTDRQLQRLSWPVSEFCAHWEDLPAANWNSRDQLAFLQETLLTLALPQFEYTHHESEDWTDACSDVWDYISAVVEENSSAVTLYSKVASLLRRSKRDFEQECLYQLRLEDCDPCYVNMPWTEIVTACIEYKLSLLEWMDPASHQYGAGAELKVHYLPGAASVFKPPQCWLQTTTSKELQPDMPELSDTVARSGKRKVQESMLRNTPKQSRVEVAPPGERQLPELTTLVAPPGWGSKEVLRLTEITQVETPRDRDQSRVTEAAPSSERSTQVAPPAHLNLTGVTEVTMDANSAAHALNKAIAIEKKKSREFEDFLLKALAAGDDPYLDMTSDLTLAEVSSSKRSRTPDLTLAEVSSSKRSLTTTIITKPLTDSTMRSVNEGGSMARDLDKLSARIESVRQADRLFEMKLQSYLTLAENETL